MTKKNDDEETITEEKSDEAMPAPPEAAPELPEQPIAIILTYYPSEGRLSINSSGEVNVGLFLEMLHGAEKRIMTLPIGNST